MGDSRAVSLRAQTERFATDLQRPVHSLFGLPIDAVSMAAALSHIRAAVANRTRYWISTSNVQYVSLAHRSQAFRDSVIQCDLLLADGMPLIWLARLFGVPITERVAGSDLFEALLRGEGGPLKVYFFGGPDGVAEKACERLNALNGPLTCVGFASPGFGSVEEMSAPAVIECINRSAPDFLVVALGASKGHAWIQRNRGALHAPVVSHLGAVVNFVAGTVVRAPRWMRERGLEWLWRIKEEPALWRRYWNDAVVIIPPIATRLLQRWRGYRLRRPKQMPAGITTSVVKVATDVLDSAPSRVQRATLHGSWAHADLPLLRSTFKGLAAIPSDIELDFGPLEHADDSFVGLLLLLYGHQKRIGHRLTLSSPSETMRNILEMHGAGFLLDTGSASNRD
jgi:N-acetylglucosaminyldiphosphoundecaprenol N-acetyl-beta-D-mannosaminyltransferase